MSQSGPVVDAVEVSVKAAQRIEDKINTIKGLAAVLIAAFHGRAALESDDGPTPTALHDWFDQGVYEVGEQMHAALCEVEKIGFKSRKSHDGGAR
jgi:hypothetical protein